MDKKRGRGRPALKEGVQTWPVTVRVPIDEHVELCAESQRQGVSVPAVLRQCMPRLLRPPQKRAQQLRISPSRTWTVRTGDRIGPVVDSDYKEYLHDQIDRGLITNRTKTFLAPSTYSVARFSGTALLWDTIAGPMVEYNPFTCEIIDRTQPRTGSAAHQAGKLLEAKIASMHVRH